VIDSHMREQDFTDHQRLVSVPMKASIYRRLSEIHGRTEIHDVYIPSWVTMFTVFVQMTPRWDGQARDVLLGVLSSPYLHPKIAIAVDEDVNIYDPRELFWAISTRVNPERDVIMIPHERIHPLDISADFTPGVDGAAGGAHREPAEIAADFLGGSDRSPNGAERGRADLGADLLHAAHRADDRLGHGVHETDRERFGALERRAYGVGHASIAERFGRGNRCGLCARATPGLSWHGGHPPLGPREIVTLWKHGECPSNTRLVRGMKFFHRTKRVWAGRNRNVVNAPQPDW